MIRRDFFTTCVIGPLLGFTEGVGLIKPKECIHPELGKYLNHTLESHINRESIELLMIDSHCGLGPSNPRFRYISFPIECNLEIEFEYGCFNYTSFNVKAKDLVKINKMTIHQLVKHKIEPETDYELDGFQIGKYKFKIASICVFNNKKENNGNQA